VRVPCCARHALALRDHVDEDAKERQENHEDEPEHFGAAADVVSAENVSDDPEQDDEPGHPDEEDEHRPENVEKRITTRDKHLRPSLPWSISNQRAEACYEGSEHFGFRLSGPPRWLQRLWARERRVVLIPVV
jgi:hypothetical protein